MKKKMIRAAAALLLAALMMFVMSGCEMFSLVEIGYINAEGELVIPGTYQQAHTFHEDRAGVMVGIETANAWSFIDREGNFATKETFAAVRPYYEGLAPVVLPEEVNPDGYWSYVDTEGKPVFGGAQFLDASVFVCGMAPVQEYEVPQKYGLIDLDGHYVLEPAYDLISVFDEESGLAMVRIGGETAGRCGYINTDLEEVIAPQYYYAGTFHDGLAAVKMTQSESIADWGFINTAGELVIGGDMLYVGSFGDGLCPVLFGEGLDDPNALWGYIDTQGNVVIEPQFLNAGGFSEGKAAVQLSAEEKDWAYIDTEGNILFHAPYAACGQFGEGLAPVVVTNGMQR